MKEDEEVLPGQGLAASGVSEPEKPRIYAFSNVVGGGEGVAFAMAEDGTVLGSHWCSDERYVRGDLGVNEGSRPDRHVTYAAHYPQGYEMEFVPASQVATHSGISRALERNQVAGEAAKAAAADTSDRSAMPRDDQKENG